MVSEALSSLEADVAALVRAASSTPLPIMRLEVGEASMGPIITGRVLTLRQAREVRRLATVHGAAVDIAVMADPELALEEGWFDVAGEAPTEVWRDPSLIGRDYARQTEYLGEDGPLRQLGSHETMRLVQGPDLTLGWVGGDGLVPAETGSARARWTRRRRAQEGEALLPGPGAPGEPGHGHGQPETMVGAARTHLGAPYRWGGTTERGFDCSGLVQRVFSSSTGVLLPKHTSDQRRVGARVAADSARAGDLLFAAPRGQRVGHVMLLTAADTVLHACRTEMRVIEEPLAVNARRYQHRGFRRPVLFGQ